VTGRYLWLIPTLALAACGGSVGAGGADSSPSPAPTTCASLPPATAPDATTTLGPAQNHQAFCLHTGDTVTVFLNVPLAEADTGKWAPVQASDTAMLKMVPSGALTLVRGVTAGIFKIQQPGTSRLSSSRPSGQTWEATIIAD
jgi:hypothetical protein